LFYTEDTDYSLLFNFQLSKNAVPNLGSLDDEIKKVFDFKGGQFAFTKGVHILDEPFLIDFIEDQERKEVLLYVGIKIKMVKPSDRVLEY